MLRVGLEGKSIAIIDIVFSLRMEYISTTGRGGESTTADIPIHHIRVGEGDDVGSGNGSDDAANSIFLSSSSLYWGQTTKQTKEDIIRHRLVRVKIKSGPEGSREHYIHYPKATKLLLHTFGDVKHFVPKSSEGGLSQSITLTYNMSTLVIWIK